MGSRFLKNRQFPTRTYIFNNLIIFLIDIAKLYKSFLNEIEIAILFLKLYSIY